MNQQDLGLRARKRIETRKKLEVATIELIARDGLEQASIEAICAHASVSPRTFFNYFESKEEAILGMRSIDIKDSTISRHIESHQGVDVIESIVTFMVKAIAPALVDSELRKTRMQIIRQNPQLLGRQVNQKTHMAHRLKNAVQRIASSNQSQAEVLLALCMSAVRAAIQEQVSADKKLSEHKIIKQSLQTISEVTKIIS